MKHRGIVLALLLLVLVNFIAFSPSLGNGFINWDDEFLVTENPLIRDLSLKNITALFTPMAGQHYIPMILLSFSVEHHFFGLNPFYYHLTNVILHLINIVLVFFLIWLLDGRVLTAFLAAMLFGIHPLRVESVAWVSERKDLLYGLFFLASLIWYVLWLKEQKGIWYALSLVFFLFSLLSKTMSVTLPFLLLLLDYLFQRKIGRKTLVEKIPYLVLAGALAALLVHSLYSGSAVKEKMVFNAAHNMLLAGYLLLFYLGKIMLPLGLSPVYPYHESIEQILPPHCGLYFAISLSATVLILIAAGRSRRLVFGWLFFLITIFPVLQLVPTLGRELTADRNTYIPSIGIIYLACEGLTWLYATAAPRGRALRAALTIAVLAVICLFGSMTWHMCAVWKNGLTLWSEVVRCYPRSFIGHHFRGTWHVNQGNLDEALKDFDNAVAVAPANPEPFLARGKVYVMKGDSARALADFNEAITLRPDFAEAYFERGNLLSRQGEGEKALEDFSRIIAIAPRRPEGYCIRGDCLRSLARHDEALVDYGKALELDPSFPAALKSRGNLFYGRGEYDRALSDYEKAIALGKDEAEVHFNCGNICLAGGRPEKALSHYSAVIKLEPESAIAFTRRGDAWRAAGDAEAALTDYARALALDPRRAEAYNGRGTVHGARKNYRPAIDDFSKALELNPRLADAFRNRAITYFQVGDFTRAHEDIAAFIKLGGKADPRLLRDIESNLKKSRPTLEAPPGKHGP
ncbi:MAG: tetratricopeptide repeat protein [Candidatus Eremiobacteraeota bacterium]|nr:tetratricopeptide repeat protein [Candidatus Eremiobacteraeota bacterium]